MMQTTRDTVLFWLQVALGVTAMVVMLGALGLAAYFILTHVNALEESRAKDRALLQQHQSMLADHDRAREESHAAFMALLARQRQ